MIRKYLLGYFKTFFLTLIAVCIIVILSVGIMFVQVIAEENFSNNLSDENLSQYAISRMIGKCQELEQKNPDNYKINLKLGKLYELENDLVDSEAQYSIAVKKAPFNAFLPSYRLALVYIKLGKIEQAQALMDNFGEKPYRKLIRYKADVYCKIGDNYYQKGDYEDASLKYQKSLAYYKVLNRPVKIKELKGNIASSYVYIANQKVKEMKIDDAIAYLNLAKAIINAPLINYNLGLLYFGSNPQKAYDYFQDVFKQEPNLINYDDYYKLLSMLSAKAEIQGNFDEAQLYEFKLRKIKKYYNENLLSVSDIGLRDLECKVDTYKLFNIYKLNVNMILKNTSNFNINSLYMYFVFKNKDEIIDKVDRQIINDRTPLTMNSDTDINITTKTKSLMMMPEKITLEIFVSKTATSYKLLLKTITIDTEPKAKKNKFKEFFLERFLEYF